MGGSGLCVALGQASITGRRERNEDFYGCITPTGNKLISRGICAVVADGMGGSLGGLEAAQTAVKSLLSDYYSTPDAWRVSKALSKVLAAANSWIHAEGRRNPLVAGMATTLSAVVLKGRHYVTAHVGDSRIYLLRDGRLKQLSTDHVRAVPGLPDALTRAMGLDYQFSLESVSGELAPDDRFLLVTDGVTGALTDADLTRIARAEPDPQTACDRIVQAAFETGSNDNITAQIVAVTNLPDATAMELAESARALPIAPNVSVGDTIDGFDIVGQLYQGSQSRVYRALDKETGIHMALKFPAPQMADDPEYLERFMREEWVGLRLKSPHIVHAVRFSVSRRTRLYYAMPYVEGMAASELLKLKTFLPWEQVVAIGRDLSLALCDLHRSGIAHRDIKPENVHITPDGKAVLLDLGTARVEGLEEQKPGEADGPPGTPSYMAPELLQGEPGNDQSDIYAVGATLYHLLTGRYPYGEVLPFSRPSFATYTPVRQLRPDIPEWLDHVITRATAKDVGKRYEKVTAMLYHLEHPDAVTVEFQPLLARNPVGFWQTACLVMTGLCVVLLTLLIRLG